MKQNRRNFIKAAALGSAGAISLNSCSTNSLTQPVNYSALDEILSKPVLKNELLHYCPKF